MLCDTHKLYMGVAHFFYIGSQFMGSFHIGIISVLFFTVLLLPGTQMDFINADRLLCHICLGALGDPVTVIPGKSADIGSNRGSTWAVFCTEGKWICFIKDLSCICGNGEFVKLANLHTCVKVFPDAGLSHFFHRIGFRIPAIEITYQMDCLGMWRPYTKIDALFAVVGHGVSAQLFINLIVGTCTE